MQTDIKCALSFASLTQVGIIVAEIGLRVCRYYLPLVHILGHACLRTLQFLRAPTLLHDYHTLENAIGGRLAMSVNRPPSASLPPTLRGLALPVRLERGYLDALLTDYVVRPVLRVFPRCDALERRWTDFLSGGQSRESDALGSVRRLAGGPVMSALHLPWLEAGDPRSRWSARPFVCRHARSGPGPAVVPAVVAGIALACAVGAWHRFCLAGMPEVPTTAGACLARRTR